MLAFAPRPAAAAAGASVRPTAPDAIAHSWTLWEAPVDESNQGALHLANGWPTDWATQLTLTATDDAPGDRRSLGAALGAVWGKPVRVRSSRLLEYAALTGLLLATDHGTATWADSHLEDQPWARSVANVTNDLGSWAGLAAIGGLYLTGNRDDKNTARLALAAAFDAALMTESLKWATGRQRPGETNNAGVFQPFSGMASMPSGHTAMAFSMARVLAHLHPRQRWMYYSLASLVGLARVQRDEHFVSDVFVGALVGEYAADRVLANSEAILRLRFEPAPSRVARRRRRGA